MKHDSYDTSTTSAIVNFMGMFGPMRHWDSEGDMITAFFDDEELQAEFERQHGYAA